MLVQSRANNLNDMGKPVVRPDGRRISAASVVDASAARCLMGCMFSGNVASVAALHFIAKTTRCRCNIDTLRVFIPLPCKRHRGLESCASRGGARPLCYQPAKPKDVKHAAVYNVPCDLLA